MRERLSTSETGWGAWALLLTLIVTLFRQGGTAPQAHWLLAAGLIAATIPSLPALFETAPLMWRQHSLRVAATAILLLTGWLLIDGLIHHQMRATLPWLAACVLAAATLGLSAALDHDSKELLAEGLALTALLIGAATWAGLAWHLPRWSATGRGLWRADGPLTYSNATAAALVVLILACVDVAGREHVVLVPISARIPIAVLATAACAATLSRGGALALTIGCLSYAVWAEPAGRRRLATVLAGGFVAALGLVPGLDAAHSAAPLPAVAALVTGVLVAIGLDRLPHHQWVTVARGSALLALVSALVVAAVLVSNKPILHLPAPAALLDRFTLNTTYRAPAAQAAIEAWRGHPVTGLGPQQGSVTWRGADGASRTLTYVHDEYLQVLLQFGLPALLFALTAMAGLFVALRAALRSNVPHAALALSASAAFAVQSGLDFLWHVPALLLLWGLVAGFALPQGNPASIDVRVIQKQSRKVTSP